MPLNSTAVSFIAIGLVLTTTSAFSAAVHRGWLVRFLSLMTLAIASGVLTLGMTMLRDLP